MSVQKLLSALSGVHETGARSWVACCPNHADRSPSLSIRELDDGRVLLHCFAECPTEEVLHAVGLEFDVLFPAKLGDHLPREHRPFPASDVLRCLATEAEIVTTAADNLANGLELVDADRDRLRAAAIRIRAAEELS